MCPLNNSRYRHGDEVARNGDDDQDTDGDDHEDAQPRTFLSAHVPETFKKPGVTTT